MVVFQSYDYASTMLCKHKGAQAMLSEKLGQKVSCSPSQVHRSNTVMEHSSAASSIVTSIFEILEPLYVLFSSSIKRHSVLTAPLHKAENALLFVIFQRPDGRQGQNQYVLFGYLLNASLNLLGKLNR